MDDTITYGKPTVLPKRIIISQIGEETESGFSDSDGVIGINNKEIMRIVK